MLTLLRSARIQIPITRAPMASPVTTFRVRSFCVFFCHCWSSTCRMKLICSWERPSLVGSILVAKGALDSVGVLSAMSAVSGAGRLFRNSQTRSRLRVKSSAGLTERRLAHRQVVRSALRGVYSPNMHRASGTKVCSIQMCPPGG